jgi:cytochrome c-type biogenesis protein CcmF
MQPDLAELDPVIEEGDKRLLALTESLPADDPGAAAQLSMLQGQVVRSIGERYVSDPPPANFRVNVNPLVTWIWLGGGIALLGALIAIWPSPAARRRRVSDVYAARLARELSGA